MRYPSVSIVVPNYNHARFLPRCLDALTSQSILPSEILVIDDGSTDDSVSVLDEYASRHPVVRVLRNEQNLGVVPTMNRGLAEATGEYVGFLAADDRVLPRLFERTLPLLVQYPQAGMVCGMCEWRCEDTGLVWYQGTRMPREACYVSPPEMVRLARTGRLSVAAQNALFKRSALVAAGGWIPELRWFTDCFGTWIVGFRYGICHVPEVLSVFHTSRTSYYHSGRSRQDRLETMERFLTRLEDPPFSDVAPLIRDSGLLGGLGGLMFWTALRRSRHWEFLRPAFLRLTARRSAEVVGRRVLPQPVARLCARLLYGLR